MPKIRIDNRDYEVAEGRNVLQAALDHDLDLPYFCWHPAMGSVGACRLCAVKQYRDDADENGRLVMGCMTPASDGIRVAIDEPEATQFRRSVIEWLMINHPHDCPVCDEGGECHLQDMTVMTGHAHRRYRGRKRTYRNQDLGPLIHHEMNRCIQCYRCVRFYGDHSGGEDLGAFASRDRVYFGRTEDGVLESPFAGNLVEVCPTGVFTDKPFRSHYTRKWDLQSAPSICGHCGLGCNTLLGARYGSARRVTSRYNSEVNGYWLCDRGRFGYDHLNDPTRPLEASAPTGEGGDRAIGDDAQRLAATAATAAANAGTLAVVGSPRASLESNFVLRDIAGGDRFCCGLAEPERRLVARFSVEAANGAFHVPSLLEVETADVVVVLGADLTNEAPLLDLALYRATVEANAKIFLVGTRHGRLDRFSRSVEHLDATAATARATSIADALRRGGSDDPVAAALAGAQQPLIITGTQHRSSELLAAAFDLAAAVTARGATPSLALAVPEANSLGVILLDNDCGSTLPRLVESIESGEVTTLLVAENDLFARFDDQARLSAALRGLEALIVLDTVQTQTMALATHALPVAAIAESSGTLVNAEGRMQRFFQVLRPAAGVLPTWRLARDLFAGIPDEARSGWNGFDDVVTVIAARHPQLASVRLAAPDATYRRAHQAVPRMAHRYSGRNATLERDALDSRAGTASRDGELPTIRRSEDPDTPFAFSMEGFGNPAPPALQPRVWAPGWNSSEAINQFQIEVGGALHGGDPGVRVFPCSPDAMEPAPATIPAISPEADRKAVSESVLVCAAAEIFGSETTSRKSPAISELTPATYIRLHPDRANNLGLVAGETRTLRLHDDALDIRVEATVELDTDLPEHVAVIPAGYPETIWWQEPVWMCVDAGEEAS